MALSNTQLRYYDSNVLRLPAEKRKEYHEQVDRLISELCKSVRNKTEIKITRVVKAGSFAKYTILRKTNVDPVDVDVVFYIADKDADHETLKSLGDTIYDLLIKQYPTKSVEDFEIQRKAATVTFVGTGLPGTVDAGKPVIDRQRRCLSPSCGASPPTSISSASSASRCIGVSRSGAMRFARIGRRSATGHRSFHRSR